MFPVLSIELTVVLAILSVAYLGLLVFFWYYVRDRSSFPHGESFLNKIITSANKPEVTYLIYILLISVILLLLI